MKRIIEFLFEIGMLKKTPRTGYPFLGSGKESVADHSFRTAVIGYALAALEPRADQNRVTLMCLFHDFPEARTGDHNYVNKKYVHSDEKGVLQDQLNGLPFSQEIMGMTDEFNGEASLEAQLARDADQLEMILELKTILDCGNPNAQDWLEYAVRRLVTASGKKMAEQILQSHSSDWWFDKNSDWWINGPKNHK